MEGEFGRIGVDAALKLCAAYDLSLDWIYRGLNGQLPHGLAKRLQELAEAEVAELADGRDWLDLTAAKKRS